MGEYLRKNTSYGPEMKGKEVGKERSRQFKKKKKEEK